MTVDTAWYIWCLLHKKIPMKRKMGGNKIVMEVRKEQRKKRN